MNIKIKHTTRSINNNTEKGVTIHTSIVGIHKSRAKTGRDKLDINKLSCLNIKVKYGIYSCLI